MTAEEYIKKNIGSLNIEENFTREDLAKMFIEFTEHHVNKALIIASMNAKHIHKAYDKDFKIDVDSILQSYSLEKNT